MVRIRFQRVGLKGQPSYRIVVLDRRRKRDGGVIENIGHHNPRTRPETNVIKEERALYWLGVGAQPSDAVRRVLEATGTMGRFQRMRDGEDVETLVAEREQELAEAEPNAGKTSFPAPGPGESKIKSQETLAEDDGEAEAEAEPEAEVEG